MKKVPSKLSTQEHLKQPTQNPRIPKKTNPITEGTKMTEQRHATQEQKKERRGKSARVLGIPSYSEKRALKKAGKKVERSEGVKKEVVEYSEGRYDIQRGDPREIEGRESYKVTYEGNYTPEEIEALEKQMVFKAEGGMRSSMKQKTIVTSTNKTGTVVKTKKIGGKVTKTITSGGKVISEETKNESIPEFESSDQVRTSNLSGLGTMTEKKKVSTSKGGVTTTTVTKKFTSGPTITKTTTGSTIRTVTKGPVTTVTTTSSGTKKTSKTKTISDKK